MFDGESASAPVNIWRDNGTLARRLTFAGPISQSVSSTDLALFAEDRWQPRPRILVELGGRIDRDGVLRRGSAPPRVGGVVVLNTSGSAILRGGFGLFYERTPSVVGAFDQFETPIDTRFAADGTTVLGVPRMFRAVAVPPLEVARSTTWNAEFTQRLKNG